MFFLILTKTFFFLLSFSLIPPENFLVFNSSGPSNIPNPPGAIQYNSVQNSSIHPISSTLKHTYQPKPHNNLYTIFLENKTKLEKHKESTESQEKNIEDKEKKKAAYHRIKKILKENEKEKNNKHHKSISVLNEEEYSEGSVINQFTDGIEFELEDHLDDLEILSSLEEFLMFELMRKQWSKERLDISFCQTLTSSHQLKTQHFSNHLTQSQQATGRRQSISYNYKSESSTTKHLINSPHPCSNLTNYQSNLSHNSPSRIHFTPIQPPQAQCHIIIHHHKHPKATFTTPKANEFLLLMPYLAGLITECCTHLLSFKMQIVIVGFVLQHMSWEEGKMNIWTFGEPYIKKHTTEECFMSKKEFLLTLNPP
ncbi:putative signal peptide protein [Puccinia sorghi]|uniref:Putative signal peptide protein n=1 Tax=Puccinia sorghi TaxID=27349 RepID=A0A0L6UXR6_9BASI|nr:putative signal peptide protein [Puccinia sorghi]